MGASLSRTWLTSQRTLYKQHMLPTAHNLELVRQSKREFVLLVRSPFASAISYLDHQPRIHAAQPTAHDATVALCDVANRYAALALWRERWLEFANQHSESVVVLDYDALFAPAADNCNALRRAARALRFDPSKLPLWLTVEFATQLPLCHVEMATARLSQRAVATNKKQPAQVQKPHTATTTTGPVRVGGGRGGGS